MFDTENRGGVDEPINNGIIANRTEVQNIFGWSHASFARYVKDGMPYDEKNTENDRRKKYNTRVILEWFIENKLKPDFKKIVPDSDEVDLSHERALLAREQRRSAEIKNDMLMRELIESHEALQILSKIFSSARNKLWAIKTKLRTRLPELSTKDLDVIEQLIHDACNEMPEQVSEEIWNDDLQEESETDD